MGGADFFDEALKGGKKVARDHPGDRLTRVEVHLSDVNAAKHGVDDKRCLLEARLAGLQPLAVSHEAESLRSAITGATRKLVRSLDSRSGD
jgi:hypothetical protein